MMAHPTPSRLLPPPSALSALLRDTVTPHAASDQILQVLVQAARLHLGLELGFISAFRDGRRVVQVVDAAAVPPLLHVGDSAALEETYCQGVVEGQIPRLIRNAQTLPAVQHLPVTHTLGIGAHLSVPITLPDGSLYGTFCCLSQQPDESLTERDVAVLQALADVAGALIQQATAQGRDHLALRQRVEAVLAEGTLSMVWQPIMEVQRRVIIGMEALARFPTMPRQPVDRWFQDAAQVGLAPVLELAALEQGLAILNHLPSQVYLTVNVSAPTLLTHQVYEFLARRPLHQIVVEITEHDVVQDYVALAQALQPVRARGLRLAVDDVGAGYASFRHILHLQPEIIKLDMSVTRDIDRDTSRDALVAALVQFAHKAGSTLVAEGVETAAELAALQGLGVAAAQGYFLATPRRRDELGPWWSLMGGSA